MTAVFLKLLNMSIAASWLVLAVIFLRFFLKKAPRWTVCLLWCIVALRLVMPFSFESAFSLIPSAEVIPLDVAASETPAIYSGIPAVNSAVNPLVTQRFSAERTGLEAILFYAATVWLAGVGVMLLYSAVTWLKLRRQVRVSIPYRDNVYICDNVSSPFLLGIFRPRIYIPSGATEEQLHFVLAHENAHLKRRDHWWKPLGFLLLTVYWFNPLLWAAYILLCRDIERCCDEKVIAGMDPAGKVGYSRALADCSVHRRMVMACPVAFGELSVKARIKGVLNYKKPAFWIICASVLICVITAACFLTNPVLCSHEYQGRITVEPTCTETGMQTRVCTHCQHSYAVLVDLAAHSYDSGVVTEAPTCVHQGSKLLECVNCGSQKPQPIEETGHIVAEPFYVKEPNCTEEGARYATCGDCNAVFVTQVLQTNNDHHLQETVLKDATCASPGEGAYICTRCDYSESCAYERMDHDLQETVLKDATCTSPGEGAYICSRCDYSESCTYEQLDHNLVRRLEREPSCMTYGIDRIFCTECDFVYFEQTELGHHNWVADGYRYKVCTYCGWRQPTEDYSLF